MFMKSDTEDLPMLINTLRVVVLAMGECVEPTWWKTQVLNEAGLGFLQRIYPRSFFRAAAHAAGKAACLVHDDAVGRIGVYHLFRLPENLEIDIYRLLPEMDEQLSTSVLPHLGNPESIQVLLSSMCDSSDTNKKIVGPVRIGSSSDLFEGSTYSKIAAIYNKAFIQGKPSYPYFVLDAAS